MMVSIESVVEACCRELLGAIRREDAFDVHARFVEDYGLSSLQLVTLVTTVCEESGLPLTALTERDIARMKTASDVAGIIQGALQAVKPA
ncbi:acyl carrier protein [Sorangium sp. So ce1128]